jgi:signal transduction histidine kinase/ActR/RegA family two-component response regulator
MKIGVLIGSSLLGLMAILAVILGGGQSTGLISNNAYRHMAELRRLDEKLTTETLKLRLGLLWNYDAVHQLEETLRGQAGELEADLRQLPDHYGMPILSIVEPYIKRLDERRSALDAFQSENATLNNSLRLLPDALERALEFEPQGESFSNRELRTLAQEALNHYVSGRVGEATESLQRIAAAREDLTESSSGKWQSLARTALGHAQLVIEKKDTVEQLLADLLLLSGVPEMNSALELFHALGEAETLELSRSRSRLYAICGLLVALAIATLLQTRRRTQEAQHSREATQEMATSKLLADEANEAKTSFLANMSHEIRTPMNGVIGMADALMQTELSIEQRDCAKIILQSSQSLLALINDILDLSKVEAGHVQLEIIPFDLRGCLGAAVAGVAPMAQQKSIGIHFRFDPQATQEFIGDQVRIGQVVTNLLSNAVKFTSEGQVSLDVSVEPKGDGHAWLQLEVSDSGIGIPADKLDTIFEKFTQAEASTTRQFGGTGLGLSIVKSLSELMDGELTVTSKVGVGSCFSARLDIQLDSSSNSKVKLNSVLLAIENGLNRSWIQEALESAGAAVTQVKTSLELEQELGNRDFEALVFDEQLGLELPNKLPNSTVALRPSTASAPSYPGLQRMPMVQAPTRIVDMLVELRQSGSGRPTPLSASTPVQPKPLGRRVLVLVAEDNHINQKVALKLMTRAGLEVSQALNGQEALEMAQIEAFDLIFMDCQMPVMDGFEATRQIHRALGADCPPIVALTGNAMQEDLDRCRAAGMQHFMSKPFQSSDLQVVLRAALPDLFDSDAA